MKCERCQQEFTCESLLKRHMERKRKCDKIAIGNMTECQFCKKPMANMYTKVRHEKKCKFKEDYVRNLEIQLEIDTKYEHCINKCRFCMNTMRSDNILRHESTCEEKQIYKKKLDHMLKKEKNGNGGGNVNNSTVNNNNQVITDSFNNTVNITIRPFGKENLDFITPTYILGLLKKCGCQFAGDDEMQLFVGQMYKAIHANPEHPENHNLIIPSLKGSIARIKTDEGKECVNRKKAENQVLGTIAEVSYKNVEEEHEDMGEEESRKKCKEDYGRFVNKYIAGDDACDDTSNKRANARNRQVVAGMSYNNKEMVKESQKREELKESENASINSRVS